MNTHTCFRYIGVCVLCVYLEEGRVGVVSDGVEQATHRQLQQTHKPQVH